MGNLFPPHIIGRNASTDIGILHLRYETRFINKKGMTAGSQFVGRHIMMQFQDAEKKKAVEQIILQEEKRQQDFSGEDPEPGSGDKPVDNDKGDQVGFLIRSTSSGPVRE